MAHTLDSGVHASADGTTAMHVPTLSTVHVLPLVLSFSLVVSLFVLIAASCKLGTSGFYQRLRGGSTVSSARSHDPVLIKHSY